MLKKKKNEEFFDFHIVHKEIDDRMEKIYVECDCGWEQYVCKFDREEDDWFRIFRIAEEIGYKHLSQWHRTY
jgi:hypothetical protein